MRPSEAARDGEHGMVTDRCAECGRIIAALGDGWWHVGFLYVAGHIARPQTAARSEP